MNNSTLQEKPSVTLLKVEVIDTENVFSVEDIYHKKECVMSSTRALAEMHPDLRLTNFPKTTVQTTAWARAKELHRAGH